MLKTSQNAENTVQFSTSQNVENSRQQSTERHTHYGRTVKILLTKMTPFTYPSVAFPVDKEAIFINTYIATQFVNSDFLQQHHATNIKPNNIWRSSVHQVTY